MSNKTYPTGPFSYPVVRPNVKALEAFKGRKIDAGSLSELLEHLSLFARGINPKARVLWQSNIQTDHSVTEKDGSWTIRANPLRLVRPNPLDASVERTTLTIDGVASALGALLHEVAHTVYSPQTTGLGAKVTDDELSVLRVYEDLYVNSVILKSRLPGLKNLLPHCYNWLNPHDQLVDKANNPTGQDGWFREALTVIHSDFLAHVNGKDAGEYPEEWQSELATRLRPIRDRLASGEALSWAKRLTLLKRTVKIVYGVLHKHGLYDPPGQQGQGQQQQQQGQGQGQPQSGTGAGDQTDASQQPQSSESGEGQGGQDGDEDVSQLGDDSGLKDVVPKQPRDRDANCDAGDQEAKQAARIQQTRASQGLEKAVQGANAIAEAKEQGGSAQPDDYGAVDGCFITPANDDFSTDHYNKERSNQLRRVFRTFSTARRGWLHGTDAGRLSGRRLPGLVSGVSRNVFKARTEIRGAQGAVLILIDGSGSMGGKPYEQAALAARELYEAIGHNPDYKVYAWAYSGGGSQVDVIQARYGNSKLYWPRCDGGSTPSWAAMTNAAKFLKRRHPNKKRVIVHLTDLGWNDSFITDFTTHVENDPDLDYVTIGIDIGYSGSNRGDDWKRMRVSKFKANDNIVGAVQEFAKKAFKG